MRGILPINLASSVKLASELVWMKVQFPWYDVKILEKAFMAE